MRRPTLQPEKMDKVAHHGVMSGVSPAPEIKVQSKVGTGLRPYQNNIISDQRSLAPSRTAMQHLQDNK